MALIALVSAGGAPGATTTALALTLTWPSAVLMAECNPSGGAVLPGFFGGHLPANRGVLQLALATEEDPGRAEQALWEQTVLLDQAGQRPVLPGPRDPFQAQAIGAGAWERLAGLLAGQRCDVLADLGELRAAGFPWPLLRRADLIVLVLRPTIRQVIGAAHPRVTALRRELGERLPLGLCLIGRGPHGPAEIREILGDFAVVVQLPHDAKAAARLSDGQPLRRDLNLTTLLAQARPAARALQDAASKYGAPKIHAGGVQPV